MSEDTITIRKDSLWKYSTFVLAALLIVGAFVFFSSNKGTVTGNVVANNPSQLPAQPSQVKVSVDDDAVLGSKNAPVTIIEFSDYQCPYCGRHFSQTLPSIKSQYIDTGKVKLVFRDLPLTSIHPMAQKSAEAAECVSEKGGDTSYWKMHDKIFENQGAISTDNLKSWAKELGYDIDSCLDSGKYTNEVQKDSTDAQSAGFGGTPGFVIMTTGDSEGGAIKGAFPFSAFQQAINAELEGKEWYADGSTGQIIVK